MAEVWAELVEDTVTDGDALAHLAIIREQGTLARRLLDAAGSAPSRERLRLVYGDLCASLAEGRAFSSR